MKKQKLIDLGCEVRGVTIINLDSKTDVKLTGRDNPHQGTITKVTKGVRGLLYERTNGYHKLIERRLEKEGIPTSCFQPKPRAWGEHFENTPLIFHKDNVYLQVITLGHGEVRYFCNNRPVEFHEGTMTDSEGYIISGLPAPYELPEQGGLENKVSVRAFKAQSILEVRALGKVWR